MVGEKGIRIEGRDCKGMEDDEHGWKRNKGERRGYRLRAEVKTWAMLNMRGRCRKNSVTRRYTMAMLLIHYMVWLMNKIKCKIIW